MRRLVTTAIPLALVVFGVLALPFLVDDSAAELENQVYTSRPDRLRLVLPRGWRATDQPSYPGLLLWMMRSQPQGTMVLTAEAFTREAYCAWPIACRTSPESLSSKFACALRQKLTAQRMRVGPVQPGPKDNETAGLPTVWFEYDDGRKFLRQAVAVGPDRLISLVLSAPTNDARAAHVRPFEQALRSLRMLTPDESTPATPDAGAAPIDAGVGPDGPQPMAPLIDAGAMFEATPAAKVEPVGPCRT